MPLGFLLKAVSGCDYDSDELYKSPGHAAYIKNMCLDLAENSSVPDSTDGTEGDNAGVFTPIESTEELCPLPLPAGNNYCIGYHESKETNEGYVFVFNSRQNHLIYVIDGYTSSCQIVKQSHALGFVLLPEHFISMGRCVLETVCIFNKATGKEERRKYLIYTNNLGHVQFISVTDSIATGGFKVPFFQRDDESELLDLGVATPDSCIGIAPITRLPGDNRDNNLVNRAWQFRVKFIDVWGRETEHGIISDLWFSGGAGTCVQGSTAQDQPRCLDLTFDTGCTTVKKIQIEFRIWYAQDAQLSIPTDWYLHDTIDKYDQTNATLNWWQRTFNPALRYDPLTNRGTYTFCADKGTTSLPVDETMRNSNPLALTASSVFSVNKTIGTANHRRSFEPLDTSLLDQINFTVDKPDSNTGCPPKPRTIVVYGVILNLLERAIQRMRVDGDRVLYGADKRSILEEFLQVLPEGSQGIIGYFAGTTDYAISEQCRYNVRTKEIVVVGNSDFFNNATDGELIPVQRWTFPYTTPGKKIFRVASSQAILSEDYQKTSFPIIGTAKFTLGQSGYKFASDEKEILIDQCDGDVDMFQVQSLVLCDLTSNSGTIRRIANVVQGYLYEDEISKIPIEKARVDVFYNQIIRVSTTDYNGFYFGVSLKKDWYIELVGTKSCAKSKLLVRTHTTHDAPGTRFRNQKVYATGQNPYWKSDRIYIKGRVTVCVPPGQPPSNIGVAGVMVMLTGGATAISDDAGNYTLIAHDRGDAFVRQDLLVFAQAGLCQIGRCDDKCSTCFPNLPFVAPPCTGQERIFQVPPMLVSLTTTGLRGPQNGGRYELGIVPYQYIGQPRFVQRRPSHVVDIPTIGETGVFGFSRIRYTMPANLTFPLDVKYFTFVISKNLNWDNYLTWIAEKVEFVDNTGNRNLVNPTQIKLYYGSLNEYNLQNGYATTAVWQFLDEKEAPIIGDKVEFIVNGDGKIYADRITALVKFDQEGAYILVNYADNLKDLKDGAQIKLLRPRSHNNSHLYYEQCRVVRVKNGKIDPADATGYINYFDSYMLPRRIPVPFYDKDNKKDTTKSLLKLFTFPFEHHSPSDFWGDHAANRGRIHAVNPFEAQLCRPTEIALSKAMSGDGILNGLSYFEEKDSTEFDRHEWGSITVVVPNIGSLTVICQQDNFEVGYDDPGVRMNKDGTLSAVPITGRLGRPARKKGNSFGCHQGDINTICEYKGMVMFLDRSEGALVALYGDAQDVSVNGFKGYLKDKVKYMIQYNQDPANGYVAYFHASFDPRRKQVLLTMFRVPRQGNDNILKIGSYVNQLREKSLEVNETLGYNPFEKSLKLSYSYTPEYFGTLYGHAYDLQLLSFKGGKAYMHHKNSSPQNKTYLRFYGELCEAVYEPVLNAEPGTVKRYLWNEVLCREKQFFVDRVITESGQRSRILSTWWDKRENYYTADFKMDILSYPDKNIPVLLDPEKRILEGNPLSGKWIRVRYIARAEDKYFEFDGVNIYIFAQKSNAK